MVSYLADTNIFIRFFIKDDLEQYNEVERYFSLAQKGKIKISVLTEVILEVEYVLRKVYKIPRDEIAKNLQSLVKMTYLHIDKHDILSFALRYYLKNTIDLVDALIYIEAEKRNLKILSFDKDFKKIKS
jgi:predicted nucleic-acid-binding protein